MSVTAPPKPATPSPPTPSPPKPSPPKPATPSPPTPSPPAVIRQPFAVIPADWKNVIPVRSYPPELSHEEAAKQALVSATRTTFAVWLDKFNAKRRELGIPESQRITWSPIDAYVFSRIQNSNILFLDTTGITLWVQGPPRSEQAIRFNLPESYTIFWGPSHLYSDKLTGNKLPASLKAELDRTTPTQVSLATI